MTQKGGTMRYNKHKNIRTTVDGYTFASKAEARRYSELKLMGKEGVISRLRVHPSYEIVFNYNHICNYIADFSYIENSKAIVEDVKGYKKGGAYQMFKLKQKLMLALYGIEVKEISYKRS